MKVENVNYIFGAVIFVAIGVLVNLLPVYAVTGLLALGCMFAAYNPDNAV